MAPKKRNSFYFFMKEIQEREAAKGYKIAIKDVPAIANPLWKNLSLAEREPYEKMALQYKNDPNFRGGKLASDGTRIEDNLFEEEEKIRKENKMKQDVKQYCSVESITRDQFIAKAPQKLHYFMSFNVQCIKDDGTCIPVEIGIVEYSVLHGINREFTKILNPGTPPTGYAGIAKQISEEKHEISIFGESDGERDMSIVWNEIKSFLNPVGDGEYPPLFCERSEIPITISCLNWLAYVSQSGDENVFEVWDATYLLMELRAGVGNPLPSIPIARDLLNKTSFNYHPSTRCAFHEDKDNHFCALSYSKRLCYLLSDAVCNLFGVQLTEKHIPTRAVEDKAYTITDIKEFPHSSDFSDVRLDKQNNYYQNKKENKIPGVKIPSVPRQPASTCIAEEMNRLQLSRTAATAPGHGIGRGIRRN